VAQAPEASGLPAPLRRQECLRHLMRNKLIVIDAGHGMGNRRPGLFDPGAVRHQESQVPSPPRSSEPEFPGALKRALPLERSPKSQVEITEAELALRYAMALEPALRARGFETRLTRFDHKIPCSLQDRVDVARKNFAALLVSLHLNAAPKAVPSSRFQVPGSKSPLPQQSAPSPTWNLEHGTWNPRGHEVLYRTARSAEFAEAVSKALARHIPAHGAGVVRRAGLYVLHYDPSVLVEVGYLDSDQDYALLADDLFKTAAMESVAGAIAEAFESSKFQVPSSKSEVSAPRAGTWNLELNL